MQLIPGTDDSYRFNYWGYSTIGYFAPMARYSQAAHSGGSAGNVVKEFKTMVKECHKRGIEVLMDVVFNHTAEGNEQGPTLSFRCSQPYLHTLPAQVSPTMILNRMMTLHPFLSMTVVPRHACLSCLSMLSTACTF